MNLLQNRIRNITEEFRRGTFTQRCSQLSFGILCLFLLECSITGGGRYWEAGPVSVRILLGGLAAVLALPELFRHLGAYLKKPAVWLTLAFVGWLAFCAWRGVRAENRMDVLLTDIKGFMWLFLVPVLVATIRSRQRLRVLLSWVLAGALIQAALILAVNAAVVLMGCQYIRGYIVDTIFAGIHFSFTGYFAACGKSYIGFLHNIIAIVLVRVPGSYLASRLFAGTLLPMGLAAPAGSLLSVMICVAAYRWMKRRGTLYTAA